MCNRYASDIRKAGIEKEYYGFEEWSETRITPLLGNAVLEVFPKSFGPVIKFGEATSSGRKRPLAYRDADKAWQRIDGKLVEDVGEKQCD